MVRNEHSQTKKENKHPEKMTMRRHSKLTVVVDACNPSIAVLLEVDKHCKKTKKRKLIAIKHS